MYFTCPTGFRWPMTVVMLQPPKLTCPKLKRDYFNRNGDRSYQVLPFKDSVRFEKEWYVKTGFSMMIFWKRTLLKSFLLTTSWNIQRCPGTTIFLTSPSVKQTFGCFQKQWYPQIIHFNRVFHYFHHPFWGTTIFGKIHFVSWISFHCTTRVKPHNTASSSSDFLRWHGQDEIPGEWCPRR